MNDPHDPSDPPKTPDSSATPVVLTEVSPEAVKTLVAAVAAAPEAAAPVAAAPEAAAPVAAAPVAAASALALSAKSADALVAAAVAATPPKPPATPAQEVETTLMTAGQRAVSAKWENVQATVAIMMTTATVLVTGWLVILGKSPDLALAALVFLTTQCSNVISTYFTRSNHSKVGGVGDKMMDRER